MHDSKVLLVGLPNLLEDILEEAIGKAGIPVKGVSPRRSDALVEVVEQEAATTVVFGYEQDYRASAERLCQQFPGLGIFVLSDGGRGLLGVELRPVWIDYPEASIDALVRLLGKDGGADERQLSSGSS